MNRVLADNWDIDIAAELSDYVGEVERVTQLQQTLDPTLLTQNDPLGVNFAQAALLIQNSAHVRRSIDVIKSDAFFLLGLFQKSAVLVQPYA